MARFLFWSGYVLGGGGTVLGVVYLLRRHAAFLAAMAQRRDFFAPLRWDLELRAGVLFIALSLLFGLILVALGRLHARVEALEGNKAAGAGAPAA